MSRLPPLALTKKQATSLIQPLLNTAEYKQGPAQAASRRRIIRPLLTVTDVSAARPALPFTDYLSLFTS